MKQFKFTLQAVLVLREQQEQSALQDYGRCLMARERATSAVRSAREEMSQAWGQFHDRLSAKSPAAELVQIKHWCQALELRAQELETAACLARTQAKESFMRLLGARQARMALEELAEKQKKRHARAKLKKEQKALDGLPARQGQLAGLFELKSPAFWN